MLKDHLGKLEYFIHIVEARSMLQASKKAFVTQPQLSKIVRQLEEDLGEKLLLRNKGGIDPTQAGHELYLYALDVIKGANETQLILKNKMLLTGSLKIGTYDSISRYFFPNFLRYMDHAMPDLDIILSAGRSTDVLKELKNRNIDIAVVVKPSSGLSNLSYTKIYSDTFGFYAIPKIEDKFKKHLIMFPGSIKDSEKLLSQMNFAHKLTCDNLETVKALTEEGIGVGFLPHRVAREGVLRGSIIQLSELPSDLFPHDIIMAVNKSDKSEAREMLTENLERYLVSWSLN